MEARAEALHSFGSYDRLRSVEHLVTDKRKEEESSLAKLGRPFVLVRVPETANERRICRIEALEILEHGRIGTVRQGA